MEPQSDVLAQGGDGEPRLPRWLPPLLALVAGAAALGWYVAHPSPPGPAPEPPAAAPSPRPSARPSLEIPVAVTGRPAGLADQESRVLARMMRRFAHDPGPAVGMPWAEEVLVLAEGPVDVNRVVSRAEADRVETWADPPYLLSPLASAAGNRLRVDDDHHVTCRGQPRVQAPGFEGRSWVSLQPRVLDNACRGWWAVDLYLDASGAVDAVLLRS